MSKLLTTFVQKFCLHDGNGIRTTLFLKGCPLRCIWCQNPESLKFEPEISFRKEKCIGCLTCIDSCPSKSLNEDVFERIDFSSCDACGNCAEICPSRALEVIGNLERVENLYEMLVEDKVFYEHTNGGVTISGGEPLLQSENLKDLLRMLKEEDIHVLIETSGHVPWKNFEDVIEYVDEFYIDLKSSKDDHEELIGVDQTSLIIPNIKKLIDLQQQDFNNNNMMNISLRMPVIPGINDSEQSIESIAEVMVEELGIDTLTLLRYNNLYENKLNNIDTKQQSLNNIIIPSNYEDESKYHQNIAKLFMKNGVKNVIIPEEQIIYNEDDDEYLSDRIWELKKEIDESERIICLERAEHYTEYYQNTSKKPSIQIQKAEVLSYHLKKLSKEIYDDELIIGNFTSQRLSGPMFMEGHSIDYVKELFLFQNPEKLPFFMTSKYIQKYINSDNNPAKINRGDRWKFLKMFFYWIRNMPIIKQMGIINFYRVLVGKMDEYVLNEISGLTHMCPHYEYLLKKGTKNISIEAKERMNDTTDPQKRDFYASLIIVCEGLEEFSKQYSEIALEMSSSYGEDNSNRKEELLEISRICSRIPREPPQNLHEALQSMLFYHIALMNESLDNAIVLGRLDYTLYPYYKMSKNKGVSDESIKEQLACFWLKLNEITPIFSLSVTKFFGGLPNSQTVNIGGLDEEGNDMTNELTFMLLEISNLLKTRQPNFYARLHKNSPNDLVEKIAQNLRNGANTPALSNDDVVIPMLTDIRGVELKDAYDYILLGCVEPVSCGRCYYSTDSTLNNIPLALSRALGLSKHKYKHFSSEFCKNEKVSTMEDFYQLFCDHLSAQVNEMLYNEEQVEISLQKYSPVPLTSMTLEGCMESGLDCMFGGAKYNATGHQGVGAVDVGNSLAVIDTLVFKENKITLEELTEACRNDFMFVEVQGGDTDNGVLIGNLIHSLCLNKVPKYGSNNEEVDKWVKRVMYSFHDILENKYNRRGGKHVSGWYSATAHQKFGEVLPALPSGRRAGHVLASGLSPTHGSDIHGPTSSLLGLANMDIVDISENGLNFNVTLQNNYLEGESGVKAVEGLIKGYFEKGGMQVQTNIMDPEILIKAKMNPENYPRILVRVSGYTAYFEDLIPSMQDDIIERFTSQKK